jgi:hypothetical protein
MIKRNSFDSKYVNVLTNSISSLCASSIRTAFNKTVDIEHKQYKNLLTLEL